MLVVALIVMFVMGSVGLAFGGVLTSKWNYYNGYYHNMFESECAFITFGGPTIQAHAYSGSVYLNASGNPSGMYAMDTLTLKLTVYPPNKKGILAASATKYNTAYWEVFSTYWPATTGTWYANGDHYYYKKNVKTYECITSISRAIK
jgi:hypothetical protein